MKHRFKAPFLVVLSCLMTTPSWALNLFEDQYGHKVDLYGEIGTGGHFGADDEYGEFYSDDAFIDDSFSSLGIKGTYENLYYALEMDYQRENWQGGSGDMVFGVDKSYFGYRILPGHSIEVGLTDTAFDKYDHYGDFTFDITVETGEAGDQDRTIKYQGEFGYLKFATSYSHMGRSTSGAELGNITNGYIGFFSDRFSVVLGAEGRLGSKGESKYGQQKLYGLGMRVKATKALSFGINGYQEEEYISQKSYVVDNSDPLNIEKQYNQFEKLDRSGWLISSKYTFNEKWEVVASHNFEQYEEWDEDSPYWSGTEYSWGKEREWQTLGVNFKPYPSVVFAAEANQGEAAQVLYAYTRIYF